MHLRELSTFIDTKIPTTTVSVFIIQQIVTMPYMVREPSISVIRT